MSNILHRANLSNQILPQEKRIDRQMLGILIIPDFEDSSGALVYNALR